jgi:hypothetical protein
MLYLKKIELLLLTMIFNDIIKLGLQINLMNILYLSYIVI